LGTEKREKKKRNEYLPTGKGAKQKIKEI